MNCAVSLWNNVKTNWTKVGFYSKSYCSLNLVLLLNSTMKKCYSVVTWFAWSSSTLEPQTSHRAAFLRQPWPGWPRTSTKVQQRMNEPVALLVKLKVWPESLSACHCLNMSPYSSLLLPEELAHTVHALRTLVRGAEIYSIICVFRSRETMILNIQTKKPKSFQSEEVEYPQLAPDLDS